MNFYIDSIIILAYNDVGTKASTMMPADCFVLSGIINIFNCKRTEEWRKKISIGVILDLAM